MADVGPPVETLRAYLRDLKPEARALLMAELERGALSGTQIPGADLILQELRPNLHSWSRPTKRIGKPARLFFRLLEPFLIDSGSGRVVPGRIERTSLEPLWEWIGRDVLPAEARIYSEKVSAALLANEESAASQLARGFQDEAAEAISGLLEGARGDDRLRRRLVGQIATPRAFEEAQTLHRVLRHRDALNQMASRLPSTIKHLGDDQLANVVSLLKRSATQNRDILMPALILVMNRLTPSWQLIRLAIKSADSDAGARIAHAPLAPAVTIVLSEIRCLIEELRTMLRSGRIDEGIGILKHVHDGMRALRTEMDLSGDSLWARELAALRSNISDLLRAEIETMPGRVRRLLLPRGMKEIGSNLELDSIEVAEMEARIELVGACRNYAGEFALNQIAPRVHADLQNYLYTGTASLLDALRNAGKADRKFRQSQVDAAVKLAAKLFGAEYASLLTKAAGIAASDRTLARA